MSPCTAALTLTLSLPTTLTALTKRHRDLALKFHPDKNIAWCDTTEAMQTIQAAYEHLKEGRNYSRRGCCGTLENAEPYRATSSDKRKSRPVKRESGGKDAATAAAAAAAAFESGGSGRPPWEYATGRQSTSRSHDGYSTTCSWGSARSNGEKQPTPEETMERLQTRVMGETAVRDKIDRKKLRHQMIGKARQMGSRMGMI